MEAAGAVDAKHAPTAPWKTHRTAFPQLPQAFTILATAEEVTAKRCHVPDREALSLRRVALGIQIPACPEGPSRRIGQHYATRTKPLTRRPTSRWVIRSGVGSVTGGAARDQ